jgi:flagellar motor switch protein FliN/FliY
MKLGHLGTAQVAVEVVLGGASLTVDELAALGEGTIVELATLAGEPVQLRAGGELVAYGEVVVIDENFGIRVTSLEGGREAAHGE